MASNTKILYKTNDQHFDIQLQDSITLLYINNAVVTATLKDRAGTNVAGLISVPLNYVAASDGIYRGFVTEVFDPPTGGGYKLHVYGNGSDLHVTYPVEVRVRTS